MDSRQHIIGSSGQQSEYNRKGVDSRQHIRKLIVVDSRQHIVRLIYGQRTPYDGLKRFDVVKKSFYQ